MDHYPDDIYPKWTEENEFDGPEDYYRACIAAEEAYDAWLERKDNEEE